MECGEITYSRHAIQRMFERGINPAEVRKVIIAGETIEEYQDDFPHPSRLILGFMNDLPIHVVVAKEPDGSSCTVVTAYAPNPALWGEDFKTRRK